MIRIIGPARSRWLLLCAFGLQQPLCAQAATPGWDCQRSADGKEWMCTAGPGDSAAGAPAGRPAQPAARPAPVVRTPEAEEPTAAPETEASEQVAQPAPPQRVPRDTPAEPEPTETAESPAEETVEEPTLAEGQESAGGEDEREEPRVTFKRLSGVTAPVLAEAPRKESVKPAAQPGWTCKAGGEQQWDCGLVGADPRGEAHTVGEAADSVADWEESSTITGQDEARFRSIMARMPADPWKLTCGKRKSEITPSKYFIMSPEDEIARAQAPLEIQSDTAELVHGEVSNFEGTADLVRADQSLFGDFVTHNNESGTLNAQGNVIYREKGLSFSSDTAFLRLKTDQGVLRNSQFVIETVPARGTSRRTTIDSKYLTRYEKVSYTTCEPGRQDWLMHASTAKINKETGRGFAKNAWLEFKGVPFLYTPFMSFPVDDRRQSGFMTPTFGSSKVSGFNFILPYYFNLAPNYDATFTPRLLTNRGMLYRGEFRYLTDWTKGTIAGEYMPHDDQRDDSRGMFAFRNRAKFTKNLTSRMDIFRVSDDRYLNELGNILHIPNNVYIRSHGDLMYSGTNFNAIAASDVYQTISPNIPNSAQPYARLPQLTFNYWQNVFDTGLLFQGTADAVNFYNPDRVEGQRLSLRPKLSYPFVNPGGFVTPSMTLQHSEYWLNYPDNAVNNGDSQSLTVPIFSVDSGAFFDRDFQLGSLPMQQTLEPRLFYVYIPEVNQDDIPNFDSAQYDFNFYQLFRENRFVGTDRVGDTNQITAALTSRFIDQDSGLERLKLSLGEIFYFSNRNVQLNSTIAPDTSTVSNIVGEVSSSLTDAWSFKSTGQWNPDTNRIGRGQVGIFYNNRRNDVFSVSYRYLGDPNDVSQVKVNLADIGFRIPFADGWHVIGQWQYSILDQLTTQAVAGIEHETCCYRLSLVGLRYLNGTTTTGVQVLAEDAEANNTVFFMLELKGLTRLGDQIDRFLSRNLRGYRLENEF